MWHSYVFSSRKGCLNVIVLHSKQEHTLALGTSPAESYLLNFSEVKQIVLKSQNSFTIVFSFQIGANLLLRSNRSPQGQTKGKKEAKVFFYPNISHPGLNININPIASIINPPTRREAFAYLVVIPVISNVIMAIKKISRSSSMKKKMYIDI